MTSKIVQLEFPFQGKTFEEVTKSSIHALFYAHNKINKTNKEIKDFHDFLAYHLMDIQDAVLALSDKIDRMETVSFEMKNP